jgi:GxxExxY protein
MSAEKGFLYKELSYQLVGCFYDAYNELGPAHKEQIYHEALKILFAEKNIRFKSKPKITIQFRSKKIGVYEPDFLIDDKIVIEIKSIINMPKVFEQQLFYYMKGTKYRIGYLVNFGSEKIDIRRKIYD